MKRIYILSLGIILATFALKAQADTATSEGREIFSVVEDGSNTSIKIGDSTIFKVSETPKGVSITLNNDSIFRVVEDSNGIRIIAGKKEVFQMIEDEHGGMVFLDEKIMEHISEDISELIEETIEQSLVKAEKKINKVENEEEMEIIIEDEELDVSSSKDEKSIIIKDPNLVHARKKDTTNLRIGNTDIVIVEDEEEGETRINIKEDKNKDDEEKEEEEEEKFKGNWAGIDLGLNNYLTSSRSIDMEPGNEFMNLEDGRSWSVDLNFAQHSYGFTKRFGMVSGLGLHINNYRFEDKNTITEINGDIVAAYPALPNIKKSKLTASYLMVPLLVEVQLGSSKKSEQFFLSFGGIAGIKVGSHTKIVYREGGHKQKQKHKNDFNLNPFRYGVTARLGIGPFDFFCNYYFSPLFEDGKGPELYPLSFGLMLL